MPYNNPAPDFARFTSIDAPRRRVFCIVVIRSAKACSAARLLSYITLLPTLILYTI